MRAFDLPVPAYNVPIAGLVVDVVWRAERLVVELDSRSFHDSVDGFERDRLRDVELQLAGYRVYRITWRELTRRPEAVAARLRALLAAAA